MPWAPDATGRNAEELFASTQGPAIIVAPFVKEHALRRLCAVIDGPVTLYTRWLPHEIATGVTDLAAFDVIEAAGGTTRLHSRLHAKLYMRGDSALVGSANTTMTALGFRQPAGVELLVPVSMPCEPVAALLDFLDRNTVATSNDDRDMIAQRAARVDATQALPLTPDADSYPEDVEATPIIEFRDPQVAWAYYSNPDEYDPVLVRQLLRSLAGLGVPPGLTNRETFEASVGAGMGHGSHGRVLRECRNLPAYAAVDRYRDIMSDAGADIPLAQADERWRTFCYWAQRFVPEVELRSTQVGF